MRVVVFGSTGMVGRAVLSKLAGAAAIEVVSVDREKGGFDALHPSRRSVGLQPDDTVVNCVGLLRSHPSYGTPEFQKAATLVNAVWPQWLAEVANEVGCRVLHLSTDAVFCPSAEPATERTSVSPSEIYGLSKALGEVDDPCVLNLRFSVIGPAPDRAPSLWEWVVRQPLGAEVPGYATFEWTGCTSRQLACFISDLVSPSVFEVVRSGGPFCHFVPNGPATKFAVLSSLANLLRPDLKIVPAEQSTPTSRVLASTLASVGLLYSGERGWDEAFRQNE